MKSFLVEDVHKGGLISEGILTLVPLPTKGAKLLSLAENLLFNFCSGERFGTFCWQWHQTQNIL
jgi:hypothetical protein